MFLRNQSRHAIIFPSLSIEKALIIVLSETIRSIQNLHAIILRELRDAKFRQNITPRRNKRRSR